MELLFLAEEQLCELFTPEINKLPGEKIEGDFRFLSPWS